MTVLRPGEAHRLGIYCFYDKHGHASEFIDFFLADLTKHLDTLIVVVNGKLDKQARLLFEEYTDTIIVRENKGLDAAAYRDAMLQTGWKRLEQYDEVLCLNDTVLGPVYPFEEMFSEMDKRDVDFWGITAYPAETVNEELIPTHIQAYWHAYRRSLVRSKAFQEYWENMPTWDNYAEVTRKHEMAFTPYFENLGFKWSTYIDASKYEAYAHYPLLYMPMQLVRDDRCPVFKRRSFFLDYSVYFDQTAGQPAMDLYEYIKDYTSYDTNLIWDAILPSYNIADIARAMHLDYVLPSRSHNPRQHPVIKSAFIYHVYFMDLLDETFHYLESVPPSTDIYVTSSNQKIPQIKKYAEEHGFSHDIHYIPVKNRGRDVSALLVAACDVVLNGGYEVIGFAHDKKSSQNQENGHHGTETQGFSYKLMENTLGSREYVENILTLFTDNPRLGLLCPPPPYHALYFAHTLPLDWGPNFENTKKLIEDTLGLRVPLDPAKPTMSAMGSCYWFRVNALKPLFEHGWAYEDFLPEGVMGADGSISHAIERANGFVAQSQGYYPAWVLSDRYARIEIDSLFYTTNTLLGAAGVARRGETILANSLSISDVTTKKGRLHRRIRRGTHMILKGFTHTFIQPLPEPVKNVMYHMAWAPINGYRHTRDAITNLLGRR